MHVLVQSLNTFCIDLCKAWVYGNNHRPCCTNRPLDFLLKKLIQHQLRNLVQKLHLANKVLNFIITYKHIRNRPFLVWFKIKSKI